MLKTKLPEKSEIEKILINEIGIRKDRIEKNWEISKIIGRDYKIHKISNVFERLLSIPLRFGGMKLDYRIYEQNLKIKDYIELVLNNKKLSENQ